MRPTFTHLLMLLAVLMCSLSLTACESSGPEFVDGETTSLIQDSLEVDQVSNSHFQALTKSGTVTVEATNFTATHAGTGEVVQDYLLGVSVGLPNPENGNLCQVTSSKILEQGGSFSIYSREGLFCVVVFRSPEQRPGTVVTYLLTLSGAFS